MKQLLFILSLAIFTQTNSLAQIKDSSLTTANKNTELPNDWTEDRKEYFSLSHPSSWLLNNTTTMGIKFLLFAPRDNTENPFGENINVITEDLSSANYTLDQYIAITEKGINQFLNDANISLSKRIQVNGKEFHKLNYTATQGIRDLKFQQYITIHNKKAYVITLTTLQTTFDDFKDIGTKIMNTFKFL